MQSVVKLVAVGSSIGGMLRTDDVSLPNKDDSGEEDEEKIHEKDQTEK